jgi:hypothetical protein
VDNQCHQQHLKDKSNISDQVKEYMVGISKNGVMDEIKNRREYNEGQTQENLSVETVHDPSVEYTNSNVLNSLALPLRAIPP